MAEMASRVAHRILASALDGGTRISIRLVGRRRTIRAVHDATRWLQFMQGHLQGLDYQLRGSAPASDVSDDVLSARVRSSIGPLLRTLDLPRVHVTVSDGVATLDGAVATARHAEQIVAAVGDVAGVRDVESQLHIGLMPGDTRPSEGRAHPGPSYQRKRLQQAADTAHVRLDQTMAALAVVLARIPAGEREHVTNHLRADVRRPVDEVPVPGDVLRVRDVDEFVNVVAAVANLSERRARRALEAVIVALAELVPEEVIDVLAVLPAELEHLWLRVTTADD